MWILITDYFQWTCTHDMKITPVPPKLTLNEKILKYIRVYLRVWTYGVPNEYICLQCTPFFMWFLIKSDSKYFPMWMYYFRPLYTFIDLIRNLTDIGRYVYLWAEWNGQTARKNKTMINMKFAYLNLPCESACSTPIVSAVAVFYTCLLIMRMKFNKDHSMITW